jgi:hypothetical protein
MQSQAHRFRQSDKEPGRKRRATVEYKCLAEGIRISFASIVGLDESEDVCAIWIVSREYPVVQHLPKLFTESRPSSECHLNCIGGGAS